MKKIIIDIGHPANVHLFKYIVRDLNKLEWEVLFTVTAKDVTISLLNAYKLPYIIIGITQSKILLKLIYELWLIIKYIYLLYNRKPCIIISRGSIHSLISSFFLGIDHIVFSDTETAIYINKITKILANAILTSDTYLHYYGKKQIRFPGYKELAYLHPNVFTPDESVLEILGMKKGEKYAIVRFVAWEASHDIGHSGISYENKIKLVKTLSRHLHVFISSEMELPEELKNYQINIPPEQMHNALAFAHLFIGESSTMATESAVLGTPSIYINDSKLEYTNDLANYGLLYSYMESEYDQIAAIKKAEEIALKQNIREEYLAKREKMLADKIDVSAFLIWFIDNYPESVKEVKRKEFDFGRFK